MKSTRQRAHGNGASSYAANASGSNQNSNGVDTDMNDLEEEDDEEEEELEEEVLKACCHKHLPSDLKAQRLEKALKLGYKDELGLLEKANPRKRGIKLVSRSNAAANNNNNEKSKAAAAYRKSYRPRPFLVPSYILNKVYDHVAKIQVRNKKPLVAQVARFWSLKRERRRGAPLLKRLHLEVRLSSRGRLDAFLWFENLVLILILVFFHFRFRLALDCYHFESRSDGCSEEEEARSECFSRLS